MISGLFRRMTEPSVAQREPGFHPHRKEIPTTPQVWQEQSAEGSDQASGPTGRQSGAAPVRSGLPAENNTAN